MAMRSVRWLLLAGGALALCLGSVDSGAGQEKQKEKGKGTAVKLDGLESRAPADWQEEPPTNPQRVKQFRLSPIGDDKDNVEVIIFYFGEGQGGSAEDNIKRWKGFFTPPEGKKIDDVTKVQKLKVGDVPVTYVDIQGAYSFRFPPLDPNAKTTIRSNYRMLGVILASKKGPSSSA
jgi:hypothetical protein